MDRGVAFAYSAVMMFWVIPHILWCVHGTPISARDILLTVIRPLATGAVAGALAFAVGQISEPLISPFLRLVLECGVLFVAFFGTLLFAAGQKSLYLQLFRGLKGGPLSAAAENPASA